MGNETLHKLCFTVTGIGVVSGRRFQVSLACPDSEWLDPHRNVSELGGRLPPPRRKGRKARLAPQPARESPCRCRDFGRIA